MKSVITISYLTGFLFCSTFAYRTYYVEDDCVAQKHMQNVKYNIAANGINSVGEIRTNRFGTYSRAGRTCVIKLLPPENYGMIVTVKKVDFRNHEPCEDYIKILSGDDEGEKLCGFQKTGKERKSYFSDGKMEILYHTEDGGYGFNDGFRLIFTVAKSVPMSYEDDSLVHSVNKDDECSIANQFKCANSKCIWAGALCDGFNNCGDNSDESLVGNSQCPAVTPVTIAIAALGITTLVAIMIAICLCCCRAQRQNEAKQREGIDFPSRPNGGYIPLPGYVYGPTEQVRHEFGSYNYVYPTAPPHKRTSDVNMGQMSSPLDLPPPYKP